MKKVVLVLVSASHKLRPYFQAHTIVVITSLPIRAVISKIELLGRLTKWVVELGEFDILYQPQISQRGQVLAAFLVEFSLKEDDYSLEEKSFPI